MIHNPKKQSVKYHDSGFKKAKNDVHIVSSLKTPCSCISRRQTRANKPLKPFFSVIDNPFYPKKNIPIKPSDDLELVYNQREQKELENLLTHARKIEMLGALSCGISHDFNNILTGIIANCDLAGNRIHDPQKAKTHLDQIHQGALRAIELVKQILAFSKKKPHHKKLQKFAPIVYEALLFLNPSVPTNITITKKITSHRKVMVDTGEIHQLIMNLCLNACHSMEENGGSLTLSLSDIEIKRQDRCYSGTPPGGYTVLEVSDTGVGINGKILNKIFDPYFTTKKDDKGTGLGLASVKHIVKAHNGYIQVESKLQKGSTFRIFFPTAEIE